LSIDPTISHLCQCIIGIIIDPSKKFHIITSIFMVFDHITMIYHAWIQENPKFSSRCKSNLAWKWDQRKLFMQSLILILCQENALDSFNTITNLLSMLWLLSSHIVVEIHYHQIIFMYKWLHHSNTSLNPNSIFFLW